MQTYDPTNDPVIQETIGHEVIGNTSIMVVQELYNAREDRHELIRGIAEMIKTMTDDARRELYTQLGVHPL